MHGHSRLVPCGVVKPPGCDEQWCDRRVSHLAGSVQVGHMYGTQRHILAVSAQMQQPEPLYTLHHLPYATWLLLLLLLRLVMVVSAVLVAMPCHAAWLLASLLWVCGCGHASC